MAFPPIHNISFFLSSLFDHPSISFLLFTTTYNGQGACLNVTPYSVFRQWGTPPSIGQQGQQGSQSGQRRNKRRKIRCVIRRKAQSAKEKENKQVKRNGKRASHETTMDPFSDLGCSDRGCAWSCICNGAAFLFLSFFLFHFLQPAVSPRYSYFLQPTWHGMSRLSACLGCHCCFLNGLSTKRRLITRSLDLGPPSPLGPSAWIV
jgi:hypothetical protein